MTKRILLTGSTGYIGGRLLPILLDQGYFIRCFTRHPDTIEKKFSELIKTYPDTLEVFEGDALDRASVFEAASGMDTLIYLIHSMGSKADFQQQDKIAAENVTAAVETHGFEKIIYLGGLIDESEALSPHLKSRLEVGSIFRSTKIPSITFRASIIIGAGSLSYELIRNLSESLPFMITPTWVQKPAQPIAVDDVLRYISEGLQLSIRNHDIYEIGGTDILSYSDLMKEYCQQRHLKRYFFKVPFLSPYVSSLWLALITPIYARIGRKLIESIQNSSVVKHADITKQTFPWSPIGIRESIQKALETEDQLYRQTHWADAISSTYSKIPDYQDVRFGNRLVSIHSVTFDKTVSKSEIFSHIESIGGDQGWYFGQFLWKIRGFIDKSLGGPGLSRGRKHPTKLRQGDILDWWRVTIISPPTQLRLRAEMKLPGRAWLDFELKETAEGYTLYQSAIFDPIGLFGKLYWRLLYPIHWIIFRGMLKELSRQIK